MSKIFPIALRSYNRAVYLDVALKSMMASNLPDGLEPIIIDDCSTDPDTIKYLTTDEQFTLEKPCDWLGRSAIWEANVGRIMPVEKLTGIKSKYEIVSPETKKGVRGCLFWSIDYMMKRFPEAEGIIMIESDIVFHKEWYNAVAIAHEACKDEKGPNGSKLGLLTCYDRKGKDKRPGRDFAWRGISKKSDGRWNCGNGIGGVMYLVTRRFYEAAKKAFQAPHPPGARGGDTMLQGYCANIEFSIAVTSPSYAQHIGIESTAWQNKGWRYTKNFPVPMAFENFTSNGIAFSSDWL